MTLDELDNSLCGRCLIIVDARSSVVAYEAGKPESMIEGAPNPTNARALRQWVEEQMWGNSRRIAIDAMPDAFRCVATWQGDPLCEGHMRDVRWWEHRNVRR